MKTCEAGTTKYEWLCQLQGKLVSLPGGLEGEILGVESPGNSDDPLVSVRTYRGSMRFEYRWYRYDDIGKPVNTS